MPGSIPSSALSRVPGVAWSNPLPELLLGKITASFENAGLAKLIAPAESATLVLRIEIRRFDIDAATRQAVVELTARLIANQGGAVVAAHVFSASAPVGEISGADPVVDRGAVKVAERRRKVLCALSESI